MFRYRRLFISVWTAFFISGVAGLIYEVVWARYLDLILGGTAYAHTMVLAAYMGGLALGAWYFGRLADRFSSPLAVYAILELAIGGYGLLFPLLFSAGSGLYLLLAGPLGTTGFSGVINKLFISVLLLCPSTFVMGGTLPLLTRAVTALPDLVGRRVAGLYSINSLGAAGGALIAGFALIPGLGMRSTLHVAAGLNILVGVGLLTAWRLGFFTPAGEKMMEEEEEEGIEHAKVKVAGKEKERAKAVPETETLTEVEIESGRAEVVAREFRGIEPEVLQWWGKVAIFGAGLSGLIVMIYEIGWIRLLSTILGSSTYSFTLMLAAFITGIALGSLLARWLARFERPFLFFGASQLLIGAALLLTLPLYERLPYLFLELHSTIPRTDAGFRQYELLKYLFCLVLMLPPTLASGAALPLATDVAARLRRQVGQPVGRVYSVNTLGTIAGALIGGLILLPWLGVELTLHFGIAVNMVFGLWVLSLNPLLGRWRIWTLAAGSIALLLVILHISPAWDLRALASGAFKPRGEQPQEARDEFLMELSSQDLVFYKEDVNGTVAVLQYGDDFSLVVNGKTDASTYLSDQITQTLIAAIPALMVPDAEKALVIGLGGGQTAGHLLGYPINQMEIVEISSGVTDASHFFDNINGKPLEDPRTVLVMQDAKTYLLTRPDARYDLILSEPSNPWIAGIGGLFSREYFSTLKEHLELGGVMAQWIHAYQQTEETLGSVLLTFHETFPYVSVWGLAPGDLLLVGSASPVTWNFRRTREAFNRPAVAADLSRIFIEDLFTLLNRQLQSPERVNEITSLGGYINTDDFPYLEYRTPKAFFLRSQAFLHSRFDERGWTLRNTNLALERYMNGRDPDREELTNLVNYMTNTGLLLPRLLTSATAAWQKVDPGSPEAAEAAGQTGVPQIREIVDQASRRVMDNPQNPDHVGSYAQALLDGYDELRSIVFGAEELADRLQNVLPWAAEAFPEERDYYMYQLGQVAYDQGFYDDSVRAFQEVVDGLGEAADPDRLARMLNIPLDELRERVIQGGDPRTPPSSVQAYLGRALMKLDRYSEAREAFRKSYQLNPENPVAVYYFSLLSRAGSAGRFTP